jgi:curved DNA-binding protein
MVAVTATYYDVLGVAASATHDEIRDAYRAHALREHPDRHGGAAESVAAAAEARMREVNEAWQVLGDPVTRAAYDAELARAARRADDEDPADRVDPSAGPFDHDEHWPADRPTSCLGPILPLLVLVALLLAIVVFTAYAKTG